MQMLRMEFIGIRSVASYGNLLRTLVLKRYGARSLTAASISTGLTTTEVAKTWKLKAVQGSIEEPAMFRVV